MRCFLGFVFACKTERAGGRVEAYTALLTGMQARAARKHNDAKRFCILAKALVCVRMARICFL
jgi:hypothetical protein